MVSLHSYKIFTLKLCFIKIESKQTIDYQNNKNQINNNCKHLHLEQYPYIHNNHNHPTIIQVLRMGE